MCSPKGGLKSYQYEKPRENCKKLPWEHLIDCQGVKLFLLKQEGKARYVGLLLATVEDFGQDFFFPLGKKIDLTLFVLILGDFWCSVVTSVTFSSNLSNFNKKPKKQKLNLKMSKEILKNHKV